MARIVLAPARLREGKFVEDRGSEPIELDWPEVVKRLAPQRTRGGVLMLRSLHPGMFVGTRRKGSKTLTFLFDAAGRSRNAVQVLRANPDFARSINEVFLVKSVDWDMHLRELGAA